ncbi:porin family protein [Bacteroides heparinolyticus]|uniref:Porin family protein n=1 Tax=Prevotella heparinolytica TaxID=28113 RepID=A0A3P2ADV5_9BACE|nr:porin family protein [Bacteroides heparinolyticus]RRD92350.1 porin family protein [Bacteroides heparinolyticus]
MKKSLCFFLIVVCCMLVSMPAHAQLKWGVKGGVNLSEIDWKGEYAGNKEHSTGFFIGPMAELTIPIIGLGIDGALMYSQRGNKYDVAAGTFSGSIDERQQGIEIPVNLKYTIGLGSLLGIYIAAGPDFFFNFKDIDLKPFGSGVNTDGAVDTKKTQVGLNVGVGVKILKHLQVGVNYQIPMGNTFSVGDAANTIWKDVLGKNAKTKTWQISATYIF